MYIFKGDILSFLSDYESNPRKLISMTLTSLFTLIGKKSRHFLSHFLFLLLTRTQDPLCFKCSPLLTDSDNCAVVKSCVG